MMISTQKARSKGGRGARPESRRDRRAHYGTGVPLRTASELLAAFCRAPALRAVALTEVNPSYEPTGATLWRYIEVVADALSGVRAGTGEFGSPPAS
jgi:hypothetical protein